MALTCLELINSPIAEEGLRLVGGRGGIDKRIMWTHFLESPNVIKFLQSSELVFITGLHIKGNPNILIATIEALYAKSAAGAVITTGDALERIPSEVIQRADSLDFPLFEIPWQTNIASVIQRIGKIIISEKSAVLYNEYSIFEAVMFADEETYSDIQSRMCFYEFDLGARNIVMSAKADRELSEEEKNLLYSDAKRLCSEYGVNFITVWRRDELFMLISVDKLERLNIDYYEFCESVLKTLSDSLSIKLNMGLSDISRSVSQIKKECDNSLLALKISQIEGTDGIMEYKALGIYRFLSRINDENLFREFLNETFRDLIEYDEKHETEFLNTLEVYMNCGRSVSRTVEKLFIHRNTLAYRLGKIEKILGMSLDDSARVLEIELAFKIKNLLDN